MPVVIDLVDQALLQRDPPRRLPPLFYPNLLGEHLLDRPLLTYIDPLVIGGAVAAVAMALLRVGPLLWLVLLAIVGVRVGGAVWRLAARVSADARLLKEGVVLYAHVMGVRPCRDNSGNLAGAYLDCAIPVSQRRTHVGSVWLPDINQANALGQQSRLKVICLRRTPGIWRLMEHQSHDLRYERMRHEG